MSLCFQMLCSVAPLQKISPEFSLKVLDVMDFLKMQCIYKMREMFCRSHCFPLSLYQMLSDKHCSTDKIQASMSFIYLFIFHNATFTIGLDNKSIHLTGTFSFL